MKDGSYSTFHNWRYQTDCEWQLPAMFLLPIFNSLKIFITAVWQLRTKKANKNPSTKEWYFAIKRLLFKIGHRLLYTNLNSILMFIFFPLPRSRVLILFKILNYEKIYHLSPILHRPLRFMCFIFILSLNCLFIQNKLIFLSQKKLIKKLRRQ